MLKCMAPSLYDKPEVIVGMCDRNSPFARKWCGESRAAKAGICGSAYVKHALVKAAEWVN
ncbi:hypothetical protein OI25_5109 [Paraburkholderia fungorum]|uniref:Uncharacterized protein n=1 Tax=Paraburkholderia fungorum TaxID=134537 RepID=A0AAU8TAE3_9BURK|nr:hypothetical protein OI25_5109 [Paraburkholderia fungorum]